MWMSNRREWPLSRCVAHRSCRSSEVNRSRLVASTWYRWTNVFVRFCVILGTESRGKNTRKIDSSTCIRDTALCRTDEPLGRLTFFHAVAALRVASLITNTVPLFPSFAPCTSLCRSLSHPLLVCPVCSCTFPFLVLAHSSNRSFSPLGCQSPLHWLAQRPFFHPLAPGVPLLSSAMSSTCRSEPTRFYLRPILSMKDF